MNVIILNDLTKMVNLPTWIPDFDSHSPALLNLFVSSDAGIYSERLVIASNCCKRVLEAAKLAYANKTSFSFPPLGNSDHVLV